MAKLFGIDIARTVDASIRSAGGVLNGTLTRSTPGTRDPDRLAGGTNPTPTIYSFRGFIETAGERRPGGLEPTSNAVVSVLGASVTPAATPTTGDRVTIEGETYELVELIDRDPAAALYRFKAQVRG